MLSRHSCSQLFIQHFEHQTVNHRLHFVDPNTQAHTQTVERMWRTAKQRNKRQNGTHRHMLDSYLCEFIWRMRYRVDDLFETIVAHIVEFWPPV